MRRAKANSQPRRRAAQQSRLRSGEPLWLANGQRPKQRYARLSDDRRTEVAIVGGGITGALVAETFSRAGVAVVVLEGGLVGRGSTAASSALLLQEPDHNLADLAQRYGVAASERIWRLSHDAVRDFIATLRRLRISCNLVEREAVYFTMRAESVRDLEQELSRRTAAGSGGKWLTPGALRRLTAIPGHGAILTRGHAQFDPYRACLGLLHAAASSGAQVFERSVVTRVSPERDRVYLHTRHGRVEARRIVIATGYATPYFRSLAGRFRMYRTYVLATKRLNAAERRELGIGNVMMWDTERPYHYARWTPDHRLLLGGADRPVRPGARRAVDFAKATQALREDFETLFPALSAIEIDSAWEGLFATTPDSLPYIGPHHHYPAHLFALGYGGNGMTFGFLAARLLLEYWQGIKSSDQQLFAFGRLRSTRR
jgi:glycine/D-amino acid oxidase-like deaminating enzyme